MSRTLASASETVQEWEILNQNKKPPFLTEEIPDILPTSSDLEECKQVYQKIMNSQQEISSKISNIQQTINENNYESGIGYYNAKNMMFLQYLIQLQFYELFRINALDVTSGQGLQLYKRLVYLKTLLNKLGPVQKKLEYQKNKMLKYGEVVNVKVEKIKKKEESKQMENEDGEEEFQDEDQQQVQDMQQNEEENDEDALAYQPRLNALMEVKQKKEKELKKEGKYVAPKGSAALSKEDQKIRNIQRQQDRKKGYLVRKYMNDLREDDDAREIGVGNELTEKIKKKFKEKTSFEEQMFTRIPQTKKERFWKKSLMRKAEKSGELRDDLKQIEMIGQIFKEQKRQDLDRVIKRSGAGMSKGKQGKKKMKRE